MFNLKASPREKEFFTYMLRGLTVKEISEIMNITLNSANLYRARLLAKNRGKSSMDLVCRWHTERNEYLKSEVERLKEELSKTRQELRKCRNEIKRRQGKNRR